MLILVIGCGSIGQRHIRNLIALKAGDVIAHDISYERLSVVAKEYKVKTYNSVDDALAQNPDVAFICTPTSLHIAHAISAAKSNCHLFIEKPLSHSLEGVDELIKIVVQKQLVTLVGCNMRFHPGIALMKELLDKKSVGRVICARIQAGTYLPNWHPREDYRRGYSAKQELGGGIILDGIHEIDYITWFLGEVSQVFCFAGKLSSLEIDTEDTAEILLRFSSGTIAEVHLDYVQRAYSRCCQIIGEEGTIIWDFSERVVRLFTAESGKWQTFSQKPDYGKNEMYIEETKHFFQCVKGNARPMQDINSASRILEIALAAKKAGKIGKVVRLSMKAMPNH
jgi:predicted dehydrogenase